MGVRYAYTGGFKKRKKNGISFPLANLKILAIFSNSRPGVRGRWCQQTANILLTNCKIPFLTPFFYKLGDVYAKMWVIPNPDVAPYT